MEAYTAQTTFSVVNELGDALMLNAKLGNELMAVFESLARLNPFAGHAAAAGEVSVALKGTMDAALDVGAAMELASKSGSGMGAIAGEMETISASIRQTATEMVDLGAAAELVGGATSGINTMAADMERLTAATRQAVTETVDLGAAEELLGSARGPGQRGPTPPRGHRPGGAAGFEMMFAGSILEGAGKELAGAIQDVVKPAMAYEHQVELLRVMGVLPDEIARAESAAWKDRIATASPEKALAAIGEMRGILGSTDEAIKFMPDMLKLQTVMSAETGKAQEGLALTTIKAIENMGGTTSFNPATGKREIDPERAREYIDILTRAAILTHGTVNARELFAFAKQAGPVARQMTPDALMQMVPIMQAMGASRAGTALSSLNTQIVGGVMPERVAKEWETLHLLDMKHVHATKMGIKVDEGGVKDEALWKTNPIAWIAKDLVPAMKAAGLSDDEQQSKIMRLMGRQTSTRLVSDILSLSPQIARDYDQMKGNMGAGAFDEFVKHDPTVQLQRVSASLETFETAVGKAVSGSTATILGDVADALDALTQFALDNPDLTADLVMIAGGLAVFATVAGTILLFGGAMSMLAGVLASPIVVPILAIVAALTALGIAAVAANHKDINRDMSHGLRSEAAMEHDKDKVERGTLLVDPAFGKMQYHYSDEITSDIGRINAEKAQRMLTLHAHNQEAMSKFFSDLWGSVINIPGLFSSKKYQMNRGLRSEAGDQRNAEMGGNSDLSLRSYAESWKAWDLKVISDVGDFFDGLWTGFKKGFAHLGTMIADFIKGLPGEIMSMVKGIPSAALSGATGLPKPVTDGIMGGVGSAAGWLGKEASSAWNGMFGSPSPTIKGGPSPAQSATVSPGTNAPVAGTTGAPSADPAGFHAAIKALQDKPAPAPHVQIEGIPFTLNLDGRTLVEAMMRVMQRMPGGPNAGTSDFNTGQFFTPAGTPIGQN